MRVSFEVPAPKGATHFLPRHLPYRVDGRVEVVIMFFRFNAAKNRWECLTGDEQEIWWPVATMFNNFDISRVMKLEQPGVST